MELSISIIRLESRRLGEEAVITVSFCAGEGREEQRKLTVASKMLFEIGNIGYGSIPYLLTREQYDTLEYDAQLWKAVKKGLDLLSYGDNTKLMLIKKLRERSFDKYLAEDAACYIAELGYIDERNILEREVERLSSVKLYGKSRIKAEVYKKGISKDVISSYLSDMLDEIDFEENLLKLVRKKCDLSRLEDRKYRDSFYAAIYRLGYSPQETRKAIRTIIEGDYE